MKSKELIRLLKKDGWMIKRQKGSHIIFFHPVKSGYLVVPFHGSKEVGKGITRDLLLRAGIK